MPGSRFKSIPSKLIFTMQFINKYKTSLKSVIAMAFVFTWLLSTGLAATAQQSRMQVTGNPASVTNEASPVNSTQEYVNANPGQLLDTDTSFPGGKIVHGADGSTQKDVAAGVSPGVRWPELVLPYPIRSSQPVAARMQEMNKILKTDDPKIGPYPLTGNMAAMVTAVATQMQVDSEQSPERTMQRSKEEQNQANQTSADTNANQEREQAGSAINYIAHYLYNFTVDKDNRWNKVRDGLFLPMAILVLLPGAVLAQVKAVVSAGSPVIQDVASPFEGILRSIVAIFLIPGTYLVVNYGIDVANSLTYTISSEYTRIFGTDMYKDAMAAHVRAFPVRNLSENKGYVPNQAAKMGQLGSNDTPFAKFEGQNLEIKLVDPVAGLNITPGDRTNEQVSYLTNSQRNSYNTVNAAAAMAWNILCAFQMAYLYYLWFVGPVIAALWVYPMQQLRDAFPSWVDGVCTICFWSLFWNTAILLMACLRGVDETGTMMMTALNFLSTACVKFAFDFAALAKEAGMKAAAAGAQGGGGGAGKGGSAGATGAKGASAAPAAPHGAPAVHAPAPVAAPHPVMASSGSGGGTVGSSGGGGGPNFGSSGGTNGDGPSVAGSFGIHNASWNTGAVNFDHPLPPGVSGQGSGGAVNATHSPFNDRSLFQASAFVPSAGADGSGVGGGASGDSTDINNIFGAGTAGVFGVAGATGIGGSGAVGPNGEPIGGGGAGTNGGDTHHNNHLANHHLNAFLAGGFNGVSADGTPITTGNVNASGTGTPVGGDMGAYLAGLAGGGNGTGAGGTGTGAAGSSTDNIAVDAGVDVTDFGDNINVDLGAGAGAMFAAAQGGGGMGINGISGDPNGPPSSSVPNFARLGLDAATLNGNLPPSYGTGLSNTLDPTGAQANAGMSSEQRMAAALAHQNHVSEHLHQQGTAAAAAAGQGSPFNLAGPAVNGGAFAAAAPNGVVSPLTSALGYDPSATGTGASGGPLAGEFAKFGADITGMASLNNPAAPGGGTTGGGTDYNTTFTDNNFSVAGGLAAQTVGSITGPNSGPDSSTNAAGPTTGLPAGVPSFAAMDPGATGAYLPKGAADPAAINAAAFKEGRLGAFTGWENTTTGAGAKDAAFTANAAVEGNYGRSSNPAGLGAGLGAVGQGPAPLDTTSVSSTNTVSGSGAGSPNFGAGATPVAFTGQGTTTPQPGGGGFGGFDKAAVGGNTPNSMLADDFKAMGKDLAGMSPKDLNTTLGTTTPQVGGTMNLAAQAAGDLAQTTAAVGGAALAGAAAGEARNQQLKNQEVIAQAGQGAPNPAAPGSMPTFAAADPGASGNLAKFNLDAATQNASALRGGMEGAHKDWQNDVTGRGAEQAKFTANYDVNSSMSRASGSLEGNLTNGVMPVASNGVTPGGSTVAAGSTPIDTTTTYSTASAGAGAASVVGSATPPQATPVAQGTAPTQSPGYDKTAIADGSSPASPLNQQFADMGRELTGLPGKDDTSAIGKTIPTINGGMTMAAQSASDVTQNGTNNASSVMPTVLASADGRTQQQQQQQEQLQRQQQNVVQTGPDNPAAPAPAAAGSVPSFAAADPGATGNLAKNNFDAATQNASALRGGMEGAHKDFQQQVTGGGAEQAKFTANYDTNSAMSRASGSLEGNLTNGVTPVGAGSSSGSSPNPSAAPGASFVASGSTDTISGGGTTYSTAASGNAGTAPRTEVASAAVPNTGGADYGRTSSDASQASGLRTSSITEQNLKEFGDQLTGLPKAGDTSAVGSTIPTVGTNSYRSSEQYASASSGVDAGVGASGLQIAANGGAREGQADQRIAQEQRGAQEQRSSQEQRIAQADPQANQPAAQPGSYQQVAQNAPASGGSDFFSRASADSSTPGGPNNGNIVSDRILANHEAWKDQVTTQGGRDVVADMRGAVETGGSQARNSIEGQMTASVGSGNGGRVGDGGLTPAAPSGAGSGTNYGTSVASNSTPGSSSNSYSGSDTSYAAPSAAQYAAGAQPAGNAQPAPQQQIASADSSQQYARTASGDGGSQQQSPVTRDELTKLADTVGSAPDPNSTSAVGSTIPTMGNQVLASSSATGSASSYDAVPAGGLASAMQAPQQLAQQQQIQRQQDQQEPQQPYQGQQQEQRMQDQRLQEQRQLAQAQQNQLDQDQVARLPVGQQQTPISGGTYAAAALPAAGLLAAGALRKPQPSGIVVNNRSEAFRMVQKGTNSKTTGKESASKLSAALGRAKTPPAGPTDPKMQFNPRKLADPMGSVASGTALRRLRSARKTSSEELDILRKLGGIDEGADAKDGDSKRKKNGESKKDK